MFFLIAILLLAALMAYWSKQWWDRTVENIIYDKFFHYLIKAAAIVLPLLALEAVLWCSFVVVPAGFRGVVFDKFKGIQSTPLHEGINFVIPYLQDVYLYDTRLQKVEFEATAASKDLQSVSTKVALNFRPHADSVPWIHRNVGIDYAEKIVHPAVQEAVKAVTARYTAEELITRREAVKKEIQELLQSQMTPADLDLIETYITDFQFSADFAHAVEAKQIAEQEAFKAQRDLERIKIEAEQKIATAQAEAKSLSLQRDAITSNLIDLRRVEAQRLAIDKWDGHLPQMMMGNTTPILDLSQINGKR